MIKLTSKEKEVLRAALKGFSNSMVHAYENKDEVRAHLTKAGFAIPPDHKMDDEIYETIVRLDHFEQYPEEFDQVNKVLLVGILQWVEAQLPENSESDAVYDEHYTFLAKGAKLLHFKQDQTMN